MDKKVIRYNCQRILLIFPSDQFGMGSSSHSSLGFDSPIDLIYKGARSWAPPLGLLYIASELMSVGHLVSVIDFNTEDYSKNKLWELINEKDIIGISINTTGTGYKHAEVIINAIRDINSEVHIILGGQACTMHPAWIPGADVLVLGEAEHSIVEIVGAIADGRNLAECEGVIFYDKNNGEIKKGLPPKQINDLDTIKFPARKIMDKRASIFGPKLAGKLTTMITSRGCPFQCRFCAIGLHHQKYRERSVQNVLDEIETIVQQGYKYLGIVDDHFLLNKQRAHGILDGIIKRQMNLIILAQARVDSADEDLYLKMRVAGVRVIAFGLESGNQDTLDFYNKKTTVDKNRYAVELADKCGIYVHGSFILGAPMETTSHLKRTIQFAKDLPLASATFNTLGYLPGSKLWQEARQQGLINDDDIWVPATKERGLSNFDDKFITHFVQKATTEFYSRPKFWLWHLEKIFTRRDMGLFKLIMSPLIDSAFKCIKISRYI